MVKQFESGEPGCWAKEICVSKLYIYIYAYVDDADDLVGDDLNFFILFIFVANSRSG